jgi:hypothetical protein
LQKYNQQDELEEELLKAQSRAEAAFAPYQGAGSTGLSNLLRGFDPGDITQNDAYQTRLSEGQKALERSFAARGMSTSGAALREAQEYGQSLAAEEYDNAYRRWYAENAALANMGQAAAGPMARIYDEMGDIRANASTEQSNLLNRGLSKILGSTGQMKQIGTTPEGRPIFQDDQSGEVTIG